MWGTMHTESTAQALDRPDTGQGERSPTRRGRRVVHIGVGAVALLALIYGAAGWYISGRIIDGIRVTRHVVEYDTDVLALTDGLITVGLAGEPAAASDRDAVMGLRWDGGYAQVGPAVDHDGATETRPFALLEGDLPPIGEDVADFDSFAYPDDPSVLGVDYETVTYPGPQGDLEAWYVPGEGSTWIVAVHGRAADRIEHLRLIEAIEELQYPMLVIRYRNDPGAPATNGSLLLLGQEEWADVAAAVDYALGNGASDVVVYGSSMGGALTLGYAMEESRDVIRALVLEAPPADVREITRLRSGEALPVGGPIGDSILAAGRGVTWLRTGLDFDRVDYVDRANELTVPVLLFHGTEDTTVPIETSEALAAARPDLVEFHPLADAEHVRAWNEGPEAYAAVVSDFLARAGRSG